MLERIIKTKKELHEWEFVGLFGHIVREREFHDGRVVQILYHPKCGKYSDIVTKVLVKRYTKVCPCCGKIEVIRKEYGLYYIPRACCIEEMKEMEKIWKSFKL